MADNGFAGSNFVKFTIDAEPDLDERGIVRPSAVGADYQRTVSLYIIVDFDIGSVPDIVTTAECGAYFLYAIPVIIVIKLIAVTPQIEESGICRATDEAC